ncbi:MAG: flagellar hook-length control protein FliK [Desulfobacterium sp.]|nr:flagellar hook-length control protein FliK [Desulfobacterium sp.]
MIQGVHIFSPELVKQQQGGGKAGLPQFVKNQVVDATVLKVHSPTRAELMVAGKKLTAETSLSLVQGDTLQLKVTRAGGFEILKPMQSVHKPGQVPAPVLAALGSLTGQSPFAGLAKLILPLLIVAPDGSKTTPEIAKALGILLPEGSKVTPEITKALGTLLPEGSKMTPEIAKALGTLLSDGSKMTPEIAKALGTLLSDGSKTTPEIAKALGAFLSGGSKTTPEIAKALGTLLSDGSKTTPESAKALGTLLSDGSKTTPEIAKALGALLSDGSKTTPEIAKALGILLSDGSKTTPEQSMAFASDTAMAEKSILTAKGVLTPARLNHLRDLLLSLSLKSEVADTRFVPRLLEKSGLMWEKSLASLVTDESTPSGKAEGLLPADFHKVRQNDLKGYLLSLLSQAEPDEKEQLLPLREFVDAMEKFQVLNSHSSDSAKYLIPFPIFSSNAFDFGQIFFDLGGKKSESRSDGQRLVKVSVFLAMTNLGALRVDLSVLNKDVSAMFQVEDESVVSFIKTMIPTLRKRLRTQGFQVLQVECQKGTPEVISEASLVDRVVKNGAQNLNLVV